MSTLVYPGGWIKTTLLSTRFVPDDPRCEVCLKASCGPFWFHLERKAVRCRKCLSEDDLWKLAEAARP